MENEKMLIAMLIMLFVVLWALVLIAYNISKDKMSKKEILFWVIVGVIIGFLF